MTARTEDRKIVYDWQDGHVEAPILDLSRFALPQVTLQITSDTRPVYLKGIVVHEPRPGWQTLEVPPLEQWEQALRWLTPAQKTRVEMPEFYQMLEGYIRPRFLALKGEQPPPAS